MRFLEVKALVWANVAVQLLSHVQLPATPWTAAYQAPPSTGFSRQEYWSGVPLPSPKINPKDVEKQNKVGMLIVFRGFSGGSAVKNPPAMQEM